MRVYRFNFSEGQKEIFQSFLSDDVNRLPSRETCKIIALVALMERMEILIQLLEKNVGPSS